MAMASHSYLIVQWGDSRFNSGCGHHLFVYFFIALFVCSQPPTKDIMPSTQAYDKPKSSDGLQNGRIDIDILAHERSWRKILSYRVDQCGCNSSGSGNELEGRVDRKPDCWQGGRVVAVRSGATVLQVEYRIQLHIPLTIG